MKTKLTLFIAALLFGGLSLSGCKDDDGGDGTGDSGAEIKVESVEWKSDLKDGYAIMLGDNSLNVANRMDIYPEDATNQKQSFISSNTAVATITEYGQVTPLSVGSTTITVTVDEKSAGFTLTVKEPEQIHVTGIDVSNSNVSLMIGKTQALTELFAIRPDNAVNKSVTYASQDETIATVGETGVVTAVGEGSTTVTVTSIDNPEATAIFNVKVNPFYGDYEPRSSWTVEDMYPELFGGESQAIIEGMFDNNFNSWLSFVKPGQGHAGPGSPSVKNPSLEEGGYISFTVDMKEEHTVNYFRIRWRNTTSPGMRFTKFQTISVSDDNQKFTEIAKDVAITSENSEITTPDIIIPESTCRYIKFYVADASCFYSLTTNKTISIAELYLGRAERQ